LQQLFLGLLQFVLFLGDHMNSKRLYRYFESINKAIIIILLVATIAVLALQVFSRMLFSRAFAWAEEVAHYLFIYLSLAGAAIAYEKDLWVSVDIISSKLSKRVQNIYYLVVELICFAFFIIIAFVSFKYIASSKGQLTAALQIPMAIPYLAVPIFFVQMSIISLNKIFHFFKGKGI